MKEYMQRNQAQSKASISKDSGMPRRYRKGFDSNSSYQTLAEMNGFLLIGAITAGVAFGNVSATMEGAGVFGDIVTVGDGWNLGDYLCGWDPSECGIDGCGVCDFLHGLNPGNCMSSWGVSGCGIDGCSVWENLHGPVLCLCECLGECLECCVP